MRILSSVSVVFPVMMVACSRPPLLDGSVLVCLAGESIGGNDLEASIVGDVTAVEAGAAVPEGCGDGVATIVEITEPTDAIRRLVVSIRDMDGADVTPDLDLELGQSVEVLFRSRLVWGTVSGAVISDADGLVAAFEEGSWGPALDEADVPGVTVSSVDGIVGWEREECGMREGTATRFSADAVVEIKPFDSAGIAIGGVAYTAFAVADWTWGDQMTCADVPDRHAWAVVR